MRRGVYPGSFDPPTVAHLALADAAVAQGRLDTLDLVVSEVALGKEGRRGPTAAARVAVLEAFAEERPWLRARVTAGRLLADIAAGYDVLVVGADKWAQVVDPAWYAGSVAARDAALRRLPEVWVAPRPPAPLPALVAPVAGHLEVDARHSAVSSSAVRAGRRSWMAPAAARAGLWDALPGCPGVADDPG
ncbi:MAG TPA: hypothetical protein VFP61_13800 [Acidimicrobiales bacterium]|nr:hypothetical protein [Acidimicrobiales bacterium]